MNVSVVVPTYNGKQFIREALESVFAQTLPPEEIIVVDDASTDGTPELVEQIAAKSPVPIRLLRLRKNSGGPGRPINTGVECAKGEAVCLLEHDDMMAPSRVEMQSIALRDHPECEISICRFQIHGWPVNDYSPYWGELDQFDDVAPEDSGDIFLIDGQCAFKTLLRRNFPGGNSGLCFRRSFWLRGARFTENSAMCTDLDFAFQACLVGPLAVVNRPVFINRYNPNSLSLSNTERMHAELALIRTQWSLKKKEWADNLTDGNYWILQKHAVRLFKCRRVCAALRVLFVLIRTGGIQRKARNMLRKLGIVHFGY